MSDGSFFIAKRHAGTGFLQLALASASNGTMSVEFGLPDIDWSRDHFDHVLEVTRQAGFTPTVEPGTSQVRRFMRVVVSGSVPDATDRTMALFGLVSTGLGWESDARFAVHFEGALDQARIRDWLATARLRGT